MVSALELLKEDFKKIGLPVGIVLYLIGAALFFVKPPLFFGLAVFLIILASLIILTTYFVWLKEKPKTLEEEARAYATRYTVGTALALMVAILLMLLCGVSIEEFFALIAMSILAIILVYYTILVFWDKIKPYIAKK